MDVLMRKVFLTIALIIVASVGMTGLSRAATPGGGNVVLTLHNTSDTCVWVTVHENTRELATKVLSPGNGWIIDLRYVTGGVAKVRAQFWSPKNGCNGSFVQDRYDYIEGKTTLTISGAIYNGAGSYIMRR